mmetsp:Transcript_116198/g.329302  ORF Transcript_116198/g.329302 Transcript_116198/m.329302 type:complete len:234 (+) Transcript_116198:324-1025(+)
MGVLERAEWQQPHEQRRRRHRQRGAAVVRRDEGAHPEGDPEPFGYRGVAVQVAAGHPDGREPDRRGRGQGPDARAEDLRVHPLAGLRPGGALRRVLLQAPHAAAPRGGHVADRALRRGQSQLPGPPGPPRERDPEGGDQEPRAQGVHRPPADLRAEEEVRRASPAPRMMPALARRQGRACRQRPALGPGDWGRPPAPPPPANSWTPCTEHGPCAGRPPAPLIHGRRFNDSGAW